MELFPGSVIKTYNTSAEVQLEPNGSILKISENSIFEIEAFQTAADEVKRLHPVQRKTPRP